MPLTGPLCAFACDVLREKCGGARLLLMLGIWLLSRQVNWHGLLGIKLLLRLVSREFPGLFIVAVGHGSETGGTGHAVEAGFAVAVQADGVDDEGDDVEDTGRKQC